VDSRYGNLLHFPFEGGIAEQPSKTMDIFSFLQSLYREKLDDDNKKSMAKMKKH
jgi:hypothetical protein